MATRMDSTRRVSAIDSINPVRKVRAKGAKQQDESQSRWHDVLQESMDEHEEQKKDLAETPREEKATQPPPLNDEIVHTPENMLVDGEVLLKNITAHPEGLLDSYSGKNYAPVSPGKWLDSKG